MVLTTEQQNQIKAIYSKYFKDSMVRFWMYEKTGYMWVRFYLAANKNELINGYFENDCFNVDFEINTCFEGYKLTARMHSFTIKPIFHKYNCYDGRTIPFRQVKGDFNKILVGFDRFFKKFHEQFISDLDNNIIPDQTYDVASYKKIGELRVIR